MKRGLFPTTHHSAILAVRSGDGGVRASSLSALAAIYWKPIYKHVRLKWNKSREEAEELTQSFFALALEQKIFDTYDRSQARFRSYLRGCLDHFVMQDIGYRRRLKRGGGAVLELDFAEAERELASRHDDVSFDGEWVKSLFDVSVEALREELERRDKPIYFRLFELHDLSEPPPSYEALARKLGLSVSNVTNYLAAARRSFRRIVLAKLKELTASEEEFRLEAKAMLGVDVP